LLLKTTVGRSTICLSDLTWSEVVPPLALGKFPTVAPLNLAKPRGKAGHR
jgi:hypothetical protein